MKTFKYKTTFCERVRVHLDFSPISGYCCMSKAIHVSVQVWFGKDFPLITRYKKKGQQKIKQFWPNYFNDFFLCTVSTISLKIIFLKIIYLWIRHNYATFSKINICINFCVFFWNIFRFSLRECWQLHITICKVWGQ